MCVICRWFPKKHPGESHLSPEQLQWPGALPPPRWLPVLPHQSHVTSLCSTSHRTASLFNSQQRCHTLLASVATFFRNSHRPGAPAGMDRTEDKGRMCLGLPKAQIPAPLGMRYSGHQCVPRAQASPLTHVGQLISLW